MTILCKIHDVVYDEECPECIREQRDDLLEALVGLYGTVTGLKKWETRWPNIMAKARAAIAKAKGKDNG